MMVVMVKVMVESKEMVRLQNLKILKILKKYRRLKGLRIIKLIIRIDSGRASNDTSNDIRFS